MEGWKELCARIGSNGSDTDIAALKEHARSNFNRYGVYPDSIHMVDTSCIFIALNDTAKVLIVFGTGGVYYRFGGIETMLPNGRAKVCALDNENCRIIRSIFPYTNPVSHKGRKMSIGLGDRLGLASAGHIRLLKDTDVFPVLAQQSIRELNLTGRKYTGVLDAASWAVFQEGYTKGFGADGDHLKTYEEVTMALNCGFTMITLDCSDHIRNDAAELSDSEADSLYCDTSRDICKALEDRYIGKSFKLDDDTSVDFGKDLNSFKRMVITYLGAIRHTAAIFNEVIAKSGSPVDFEMSIDETLTPTSPESHFFVASELLDKGVEIASLAPRFCGEFQKGIDYMGDIDAFTAEFEIHCKIARHFGYKLSIHSGSDKFRVFPIIGEKTQGVCHLKTAGTNWLEAVRVIAAKNPKLYRQIHKYALINLDEAKKYYHISANTAKIPDTDRLNDNELPGLMDKDDSRQALHITYGLILMAKNADGTPMFRDDIYSTLNMYEEDYYNALRKHIGRHLSGLGIRTEQ